jgi:hypothetical protein
MKKILFIILVVIIVLYFLIINLKIEIKENENTPIFLKEFLPIRIPVKKFLRKQKKEKSRLPFSISFSF